MFPEGGPGQAGARLQRGRGQPSLHRGRPAIVCTQSPRQHDVLLLTPVQNAFFELNLKC